VGGERAAAEIGSEELGVSSEHGRLRSGVWVWGG
jgi:hypothetical protein